jgi:hypothetical protein
VDGNFQNAAAVGFFHHHRDPGQVLAGGGIGVLVRGVEGEGEEGVLGGFAGAESHYCLLGQGRVAIGFLGGCQETQAILQQLLIHTTVDNEDGPFFRVRWTHEARLYARAGTCPRFDGFLAATYSQ